MKCPKCGSENVNVQMVTESKLKTKHQQQQNMVFQLTIRLNLVVFDYPKIISSNVWTQKTKVSNKA